MRLLAINPGATYSITEVYAGLVDGLRAQGHEVEEFPTLPHLLLTNELVKWTLRRAGLKDRIPVKGCDESVDEAYYNLVRAEGFKEIVYQALDSEYDWLLLVSPLLVPERAMAALRRAGVHTCAVFTESPYDDVRQAMLGSYASIGTINDRAGSETTGMTYLPLGYCDLLHGPRAAEPTRPVHDVVFVGVGFPERIRALESVDWDGIDLGLYGDWKKLPKRSPLKKFVRGGVIPNQEAVQLYKDSLIGLNLHRVDADYWGKSGRVARGGWSVNPRAYELAACHVPQVSDWRPGLEEVFGKSLAYEMSIDSSEGLSQTLRELLGDSAKRGSLANAQHEAVYGKHSYRVRAGRLSAMMGG
jgi:spore maturation protein CgeB